MRLLVVVVDHCMSDESDDETLLSHLTTTCFSRYMHAAMKSLHERLTR